ncbi:MAG: hypothetical protein EKK55_05565 [Rhodocyclaceae bacterium]|nr:MAG: hypothetical protein EKK55_05565 [Rhodocyclaceae bacterium]
MSTEVEGRRGRGKAKTAKARGKAKVRRAADPASLAELGGTERGRLEAIRVLCRSYRKKQLIPTAAEVRDFAEWITETAAALETLAALGDDAVAKHVHDALRDPMFTLTI